MSGYQELIQVNGFEYILGEQEEKRVYYRFYHLPFFKIPGPEFHIDGLPSGDVIID